MSIVADRVVVRVATVSDAPLILSFIRELAEYEHLLDEVEATEADIRRDLFAHLTGHSPSFFAERLPGSLSSRITATSNAAFAIENTGAASVRSPSTRASLSVSRSGSTITRPFEAGQGSTWRICLSAPRPAA